MRCHICGSEMEPAREDPSAIRALMALGLPYLGTWRCPNRKNHKKRCASCDPKMNPQAFAMYEGESCDNCGMDLPVRGSR